MPTPSSPPRARAGACTDAGSGRRTTAAGFRDYVARFGARAQRNPRAATHAGVLVRRSDDDAIVGVFNFSEIVRGSFHSAYLGYYAFAPHAGAGHMADGLALALDVAFRTLKLHRVEVNVQPRNVRSHALVLRAGFVREGYSRRYSGSPAAGAITCATRCWPRTGARGGSSDDLPRCRRTPRRRCRARSLLALRLRRDARHRRRAQGRHCDAADALREPRGLPAHGARRPARLHVRSDGACRLRASATARAPRRSPRSAGAPC